MFHILYPQIIFSIATLSCGAQVGYRGATSTLDSSLNGGSPSQRTSRSLSADTSQQSSPSSLGNVNVQFRNMQSYNQNNNGQIGDSFLVSAGNSVSTGEVQVMKAILEQNNAPSFTSVGGSSFSDLVGSSPNSFISSVQEIPTANSNSFGRKSNQNLSGARTNGPANNGQGNTGALSIGLIEPTESRPADVQEQEHQSLSRSSSARRSNSGYRFTTPINQLQPHNIKNTLISQAPSLFQNQNMNIEPNHSFGQMVSNNVASIGQVGRDVPHASSENSLFLGVAHNNFIPNSINQQEQSQNSGVLLFSQSLSQENHNFVPTGLNEQGQNQNFGTSSSIQSGGQIHSNNFDLSGINQNLGNPEFGQSFDQVPNIKLPATGIPLGHQNNNGLMNQFTIQLEDDDSIVGNIHSTESNVATTSNAGGFTFNGPDRNDGSSTDVFNPTEIFDTESNDEHINSKELSSEHFIDNRVFNIKSGDADNNINVEHAEAQETTEIPCSDGEVRQIDGTCVEPIINRQIFVYAAPPPLQSRLGKIPNLPKPEVNYNIVFVRSPEFSSSSKPLVIPPPQQKTLVYVLNKRPNDIEREVIQVPANPSEPEVYYVNYAQGENPKLPGGIDLSQALSYSEQQGQIIEALENDDSFDGDNDDINDDKINGFGVNVGNPDVRTDVQNESIVGIVFDDTETNGFLPSDQNLFNSGFSNNVNVGVSSNTGIGTSSNVGGTGAVEFHKSRENNIGGFVDDVSATVAQFTPHVNRENNVGGFVDDVSATVAQFTPEIQSQVQNNFDSSFEPHRSSVSGTDQFVPNSPFPPPPSTSYLTPA